MYTDLSEYNFDQGKGKKKRTFFPLCHHRISHIVRTQWECNIYLIDADCVNKYLLDKDFDVITKPMVNVFPKIIVKLTFVCAKNRIHKMELFFLKV